MASSSINSYSRLNDSLERDLLKAAISGNQAYSILEGIGMVANAISRAASTFGRYVVQVGEALNEARASNARFSGSQW